MSENISIQDITDKFHALEKEIRDLKRDKAQAEGLCAAIMKKVGRIEEFTFKDMYNSDYGKVRFLPIDGDVSKSTVIYVEKEDEIKE